MRRPLSGLMSIGRRSTWPRRPQGAGRARSVWTPHRVLGCGLLAVSLLVSVVGLRQSGALTTPSGDPGVHPAGPPLGPESQGGPDNCGWYEFVDSDPPDPVIEFRYVSLDTLPCDTIEGLGDDNVVGPYPIGFVFPYYWYPADSFYVGSNGYISFSDDWLAAASFVQYPNTQRPNDVLGIFTDDLLFGPSAPEAVCRYYTNAVDTCIIEYKDVPFWDIPAPTGNNTFEIVLCRSDSSITYQYLEQTGSGSDTRSVGWESIGAACGFSYLFGSTPPDHDIHDSLAVRIHVPSVPPFEYHDLAVVAAMEEENRGFFAEVLEEIPLWARVANRGSLPEVEVPVRLTIQDQAEDIVLSEIENLPFIGSWEETTIDFGTWTPMSEGTYTIVAQHLMDGDMYQVDDSVAVECRVVALPDTLKYYGWPGPGIPWTQPPMAVHFVPTRDSVKVSEISIFLVDGSPCYDCILLYVLDDNGPGGLPGDTLWGDSLDYWGAQGYHTAEITPPIGITDGSGFYVAFFRTEVFNPLYSPDLVPPFSRQGLWFSEEYGWIPHLHPDSEDLPLTCRIEPWVLPPAMVTIDPFQRETAQGGSFDLAVRFRNPGDAPASTRWWIDVYRGGTKVYHLPYGNTWSLSLSSQSEVEKIYGLPVPPGAPPDEYTVSISVGPDTLDPFHLDSVPVLVRSRGQQ
jgi:hypothetical protein